MPSPTESSLGSLCTEYTGMELSPIARGPVELNPDASLKGLYRNSCDRNIRDDSHLVAPTRPTFLIPTHQLTLPGLMRDIPCLSSRPPTHFSSIH